MEIVPRAGLLIALRERRKVGPLAAQFRLDQPVFPLHLFQQFPGQVVFAHHARLSGLRADTEYLYAAIHEGADPEIGRFRTGPRGRSAFTFTSFGDQGTPTVGKVFTPPAGVVLASPPFVNDNLGSPAAGDTTAGVERVQPALKDL